MSSRLDLKIGIFLRFAESISNLSTCNRLQVGAVITDKFLEHVFSVGYNGNARGEPNRCDDPEEPGNCGCLHAETNALIKCQEHDREKVLFVTTSPCLQCAKLIVNSGFSRIFFTKPYRSPEKSIDLLLRSKILLDRRDPL